jgi:hypothetical protein
MAAQRRERATQHGLAGKVQILLGNFAAEPAAATPRQHQGDAFRHVEKPLPPMAR